jgi:transposase
MAMTIVEAARSVTGGVDTRLDVHVAATLDPLGGLLGTASFEVSAVGYKALLSWLESFGEVHKVGVEGTASYGAGLARFLRRRDIPAGRSSSPHSASRSSTASPTISRPKARSSATTRR